MTPIYVDSPKISIDDFGMVDYQTNGTGGRINGTDDQFYPFTTRTVCTTLPTCTLTK